MCFQADREVVRKHPPVGECAKVRHRFVVFVVTLGRSCCQSGDSRAGSMAIENDALTRRHVSPNAGLYVALASKRPQPTKTWQRVPRQDHQEMGRPASKFAPRGEDRSLEQRWLVSSRAEFLRRANWRRTCATAPPGRFMMGAAL